MYYEFFGLHEPPFRITPDTRLFFPGGSRGAILDAMVYAITTGEGIIKVVGEVGSGKTMLCRMLEVKLPDSVEVVYLANPSLSPENILHAIAFEMKLPVPANAGPLEVMHALQARLLEKHASNRQVVVFIEEAQRMPLDTLEEIRLLSNLETEREKLLQIVLFGQPELEHNLQPAHIRQLKERITHSFHLPRLATDEIREYLDFRMRSAGYRGPSVFSGGAVRAIARASRGLIRRVNILADKALLAAYAAGAHQVTAREVRAAARDSEFGGRRLRIDWRVATGFGAGALAVASIGFLPVGQRWLGGWQGEVPAAVTVVGEVAGGAPASPTAAPPAEAPRVEPVTAVVAQDLVAPSPGGALDPGGEVAPAPAPAVPPPAVSGAPAALAQAPSEPGKGVTAAPSPAQAPSPDRAERAPAAPGPTGSAESLEPVAATGPAVGSGSVALPRAGASPAAALPGPERVTEAPGPPVDAASARPAAASTFLERRLEATREWLKAADTSRYSIQLMHIGVDRGAGLEASLRHGGLGADLDRVWVYPTRIRGTDLYSVLMGDYASQEEARRVLDGLPAELRKASPFVRSLRDVRAGSLKVSG
jgi:type II secretory pathway predicted ATPase ExeA/septal ring-binding cell division protein DamX